MIFYFKLAILACFAISTLQFILAAVNYHLLAKRFDFSEANKFLGKVVILIGEMILFGIVLILATINPFA